MSSSIAAKEIDYHRNGALIIPEKSGYRHKITININPRRALQYSY
jgi:hypothetical protein